MDLFLPFYVHFLINEDSWMGELFKHVPFVLTKEDSLILIWVNGMDECKMLLDFILIQYLYQSELSQFFLLLT